MFQNAAILHISFFLYIASSGDQRQETIKRPAQWQHGENTKISLKLWDRDSLPSLTIKTFINQLALFATMSIRGWSFYKWKPGKKTFLKGKIVSASPRAPSFHVQVTLSCRDALTNCFLSPDPLVTQDFLLIWKKKEDNWLVLGRKLFQCHG